MKNLLITSLIAVVVAPVIVGCAALMPPQPSPQPSTITTEAEYYNPTNGAKVAKFKWVSSLPKDDNLGHLKLVISPNGEATLCVSNLTAVSNPQAIAAGYSGQKGLSDSDWAGITQLTTTVANGAINGWKAYTGAGSAAPVVSPAPVMVLTNSAH